jgi:hypothetical protein
MKKIGSSPISVALYGMDPRSRKMMAMYLKVSCRGVAVVVDEADADAEVDIIDADFATAGDILQSRQQKTPHRPIILLSLQTLQIENTFFVKKPVNAEQLMTTLLKACPRLESGKQTPVKSEFTQAALLQSTVSTSKVSVNQLPPVTKSSHHEARSQIATHKHESPATMFLGTIAGIDFNNPAQWPAATYDPKRFFLGYVQSAFKIANQKARAVQLNSPWKPLLIFPGSQEIWLDADDRQLRAFAGIEQNRISSNSISWTGFEKTGFPETMA